MNDVASPIPGQERGSEYARSIYFICSFHHGKCSSLLYLQMAGWIYNQIRRTQETLGCLMIVLAETNKIISKGHKRQGLSPTPIGNSLFAIYCGGRLCKITRQRRPIKVLKLPLCSWALPPFRFRKGTTTRLSLSRSNLISLL